MKQSNYETICECIKHGAPAIAPQLLADFNATVEFANEQITYRQEVQRQEEARIAAERVSAEEKRKRAQANKT